MDFELSPVEARIIGALMEKERTTPGNYPLSLNALTNACNQKSNRNPVMDISEDLIAGALDGLGFHRKLTKRQLSEDSRVPKYRHDITDVFSLSPQEYAVICVLLLRGPQTLGEIRGRTERLYNFENLETVEQTLTELANREDPLVKQLPRQPGRKEARYGHLLSGEIEVEEIDIVEPAVLEIRAENERVDKLELEVQSLREEQQALKQQFAEFKQQFE
ncbi:MAG: YceH family protein [Candidatus Latescibacteria bacterium]|jgi:uncharacterized protein|nr:YceH family protein [Candidatus Latescibacterota bacterium]MBT4140074.1 YceH family protein [Candidatus Latescibacterota bacterium]